jgi:hypothetical protein
MGRLALQKVGGRPFPAGRSQGLLGLLRNVNTCQIGVTLADRGLNFATDHVLVVPDDRRLLHQRDLGANGHGKSTRLLHERRLLLRCHVLECLLCVRRKQWICCAIWKQTGTPSRMASRQIGS